jgi:hypothetical protein
MSANFTIDLDEATDLFAELAIEPTQLAAATASLGSHVICELNVHAAEMNRMFYMKLGSTGVEAVANGTYDDAVCFTESAFFPISAVRPSKALTSADGSAAQYQAASDKSLAAEMIRRHALELLGNHNLVNLFTNEDALYNEVREQDSVLGTKLYAKLDEPANGRRITDNVIDWAPLDLASESPNPAFWIERFIGHIAVTANLRSRLTDPTVAGTSIFHANNLMPTSGDSTYKTDLTTVRAAYNTKKTAATSSLATFSTASTDAETAYQSAITAYETIVTNAAAGGAAPTAAELATYQTAKKNRDAALVDFNAATENLAMLTAQVAKLDAAIIEAAAVDIDATVGSGGVYSSSTYRLTLFKAGDTLSFNVKYTRQSGLSAGSGFLAALPDDHTFTIRLNMIAGDHDSTLPQVTNTELYGVAISD